MFFLGGGPDFVLFCCWCHVLVFPFSHVVVSCFFACCLWLLYLTHGSRTVVSACVAFTSSSVSVVLTDPFSLPWHISLSCSFLRPCLWEEQVFASNPRGQRRTASPVWRAAHCTMHRGQPLLDRHQSVAMRVETSGCCCRGSREQTHLPASQSVSAGGSTRTERAGLGV